MTCSVCLSPNLVPLIEFADVPRTGQYLTKKNDPISKITMKFFCCSRCGLVSQQSSTDGQSLQIDYTDVDRNTAKQLPQYVNDLIAQATAGLSKDDLIIEVGCNDGTFLTALRNVGFTNLVGVEPSKRCADMAIKAGHRVQTDYFNQNKAQALLAEFGQPKLIICRHVLEHIPEPRQFVEAMRTLAGSQAKVLIEVPDSVQIWTEMRIHELWDEHLSYFSTWNFGALLENCDFQIESLRRYDHLQSGNLVAFALPSTSKEGQWTFPVEQRRLIPEMTRKLELARSTVRQMIKTLPAPRIAIGAGHLQQNCLTYLNIADLVDVVLDDDQSKAETLLPIGQGIPVRETKSVDLLGGAFSVIETAFGYPKWIDRVTSQLKNKSNSFEPLRFLQGQRPAPVDSGVRLEI